MAEKKKKNDSREPKAAPKKPRTRKQPAAAAASAEAPAALQQKDLALKVEAVETEVQAVLESPVAGQDRSALKAELQKEIDELRALLKQANARAMMPWKLPW